MKNFKLLIVLIAALIALTSGAVQQSTMQTQRAEKSVLIWTSPDMYNITTAWVKAYESIHPEINIQISKVAYENIPEVIKTSENIGIVGKQYQENLKNNWNMIVGRDIIVPVTNKNNPYLNDILEKGIKPNSFASLLNNKNVSWGDLLNANYRETVKLYYYNNEFNQINLSEYLQTDLNTSNNNATIDDVLQEIENNKFAIAFCRLADVTDNKNNELYEGLSLVPIDANENNKIDFYEDIYETAQKLSRGVWIGKYPEGFYSNLYVTAQYQPSNETELDFLNWIIREGQNNLYDYGFTQLANSEQQRRVQDLQFDTLEEISSSEPFLSKSTLYVLALIVVLLIVPILAVRFLKAKNQEEEHEINLVQNIFSEATLKAPKGLFFDKSHTWAFMERDGKVKVGISDFLQHTTGEITKVILKNSGDSVKKGEALLTLVQYGKQLVIKSPVSGTILEPNHQLLSHSDKINQSPYEEGWIYTIEETNWLSEINTFFRDQTYMTWINKEFARLKDFFSKTLSANNGILQPVFQEGGEICNAPLENYNPEVWEEFQTEFINKAK